MSRRTAPNCATRRWPTPAPARCACARSTARSAAAPSGWSSRAGCRRANSSACGRRSWTARFRSRSSTAMRPSGGSRRGRRRCADRVVFALHPHQDDFHVPADARAAGAGRRAAGACRAGRQHGDRAQRGMGWRPRRRPTASPIVGGGVVGLLIARLCARLPGAQVTLVDIAPARRRSGASARRWLCDARRGAYRLRPGLSCQRHRRRSGDGAALRGRGGDGGRAELVRNRRHRRSARRELPQPPAAAGIEPGRQGRAVASAALDAPQRLAAALALLDDPVLDTLLAPATAFDDLPARLPAIFSDSDARCPLIRYPEAD